MSIYIDNFLLTSNIIGTLKSLKQLLVMEYNIKNMGKAKIIIKCQITKDSAMGIMKIDKLAFIKDLVIDEGFTNCNAPIIPMKAGSLIQMLDPNDYEKTDLHKYQWLIGKLI